MTLLGDFELCIDAEPVRVLQSGERLLALLALSDARMNRAHVAGVLWSDVPDERAAGNLRSTLWRLPGRDIPVVGVSSTSVWLSPIVDVDVRLTLDDARKTLAQEPGTKAMLVDERHLCQDLLPGWYEDWVVMERERFRQIRLHALERLSRLRSAAGDHAGAIHAAIAAVTEEPLRESSHRVLIEAHLAEGNRSEALRQFRSFRDLLRRELDARPSSALAGLLDVPIDSDGSLRIDPDDSLRGRL